MFKLSSTALKNRVSILVTGKSGIGKTALAATFGDLNKVCLINLENGFLSIADHTIDIYDCTVDANGREMPRHLRHKKLIYALTDIFARKEMQEKYKYLVIDSITEASQNLMESLKLLYPDKKNTLPMYGDNNTEMMALIKSIRDLNYVTVVLALETIEKDEVGRRFNGIDVIGKITQRIPAFFDEVFCYDQFEVDGKLERRLLTSSHGNYIAKDRSGKLSLLEKPNLQDIITKIMTPIKVEKPKDLDVKFKQSNDAK